MDLGPSCEIHIIICPLEAYDTARVQLLVSAHYFEDLISNSAVETKSVYMPSSRRRAFPDFFPTIFVMSLAEELFVM